MGRARDFSRKAIDWLTVGEARRQLPAVVARAERPRPYVRPRMMFDGGDYRPVDEVIREMWAGQGRATQEEALAVPGVLRARNLICGIASWPLVDLDQKNRRQANPLLEQMDPNLPNIVTKAQIFQDLLFEGVSWCRVLQTDNRNFPVKMEHLDYSRVTIQPIRDAAGQSPVPGDYVPRESGQVAQIFVDGEPADHRTIKRFDSPNPGVLKAAGATIKLAATYRRTSILYADNPRMDGYLFPKDLADPVTDDDVANLLDAWELARQKHTTGYIPAALGYEAVENMTPANLQLVELQEQATREVALALGLEPADLGVSSQTETYSNRIDKRIDRINDLLGPYVIAFDERMSMGDITPRGRRVWSDPNAYLRANPTERIAYYQGMVNLGAFDQDDVSDGENVPRKPRKAPTQSAGNVTPIRPAGSAPREASRMAATGSASATFSTEATLFTDAAPIAFSAASRRTITGVAVPYGLGHTGRKNGRKFRFVEGSIVWPDPRHVPLLIDHVQSASVGHFAAIVDTPSGTDVVARVSTGAAGDQALAWASPEESVRTGFSVGVDFDEQDCIPDPDQPGVWIVPPGAAIGKEISLVAVPAFQGARVASVTMSADTEGVTMHCTRCGQEHAPTVACSPAPQTFSHPAPANDPNPPQPQPNPGPPPAPAGTFSAEQMFGVMQHMLSLQPSAPAAEAPAAQTFAGPQFVDPTTGQRPQAGPIRHATSGPRTAAVTQVNESAPYRFENGVLQPGPEYDFSADLVRAGRDHDGAAYARALGFMREMTVGTQYGMRRHDFADVDRADLAGLNPNRQRPDLYVPQRDYRYPLTEATRRGTLTDITAFTLPKFNSSAGLVSAHTEGVEPTPGTFTVTTQTITPTAKSGAIDMTREAWDQGGTPQASALIWQQFVREWNEELESGVAVFLNTLTAATDIALGVQVVDKALAKAWRGAIARLQFARGGAGRFDMMATEQELYVAFANAETDDGDPIFPMINPSNRDGRAGSRYQWIDAAGVTATPAWALASTAGALNNSWLFDSQVVHTWDTGPQRLEFPGIDASGNYAPVAYIRMAVWGYQALANTDISGVRQVTYDTTT
jgi:hypothetical protein